MAIPGRLDELLDLFRLESSPPVTRVHFVVEPLEAGHPRRQTLGPMFTKSGLHTSLQDTSLDRLGRCGTGHAANVKPSGGPFWFFVPLPSDVSCGRRIKAKKRRKRAKLSGPKSLRMRL